jgi:hypothetical protein
MARRSTKKAMMRRAMTHETENSSHILWSAQSNMTSVSRL